MRGEDFRGRDHGQAFEGGAFLIPDVDPARRGAINRFVRIRAARQGGGVFRDQGEDLVGIELRARLLHPLDTQHICSDRQRRIVRQPYLGQDQAIDGGHMRAHVCDARVQPGARIKNHVHEVWRKFHVDVVNLENLAKCLFLWRRLLVSTRGNHLTLGFHFAVQIKRCQAEGQASSDEGGKRQAWEQSKKGHQDRNGR